VSRGQRGGSPTVVNISFLDLSRNYKVEKDEMGGTCGTNGGEEERV
jgi:hypothetical protein